MVSIEISTETRTKSDMVFLLQEVICQIEQGYTCGMGDVVWSIEGEEEEEEDE